MWMPVGTQRGIATWSPLKKLKIKKLSKPEAKF
jgi:hypothetical protein